MGEMSTPELELVLVILPERLLDFSSCQTLRTLIAHEHYSSYINSRLASAIDKTIELSPIVARVIEKRDKGAKVMLLKGVLIEEELAKKKEAELNKARRKVSGNKTVQKYGTIRVGDARLKMIARDEAMKRRVELYNQRQEEKEMERRAIADRKEERARKREKDRKAKEKRMADRKAKAEKKSLEEAGKRAIREAKSLEIERKKEGKAARKLANSQS